MSTGLSIKNALLLNNITIEYREKKDFVKALIYNNATIDLRKMKDEGKSKKKQNEDAFNAYISILKILKKEGLNKDTKLEGEAKTIYEDMICKVLSGENNEVITQEELKDYKKDFEGLC